MDSDRPTGRHRRGVVVSTFGILTTETFDQALDQLASIDKDLAAVISGYGPPPMWRRRPAIPGRRNNCRNAWTCRRPDQTVDQVPARDRLLIRPGPGRFDMRPAQ